MSLRPLEIESYKPIERRSSGVPPMLEWIKLERLVIDETFQRQIREQGRRNVLRIAENFSWSCFTPVIVAPVEGGLYSIIDGQHRATAAKLAGAETVPCQVVLIDRQAQASAFKAINGNVTKMSPMQLWRASLAAGEEQAVALAAAAKDADLELLTYPVPKHLQRPGQTMAVQACIAAFNQYGRETFVAAISCVTRTRNNHRGILSTATIKALCQALDADHGMRDDPKLLEAFDKIDLQAMLLAASRAVAEGQGWTLPGKLASLLERKLERLLRAPEAPEPPAALAGLPKLRQIAATAPAPAARPVLPPESADPLASAVIRLKRNGVLPMNIAQKLNVPVEDVRAILRKRGLIG